MMGLADNCQAGITEKRKGRFPPSSLESYHISGADIKTAQKTKHFGSICDVISGRTRGDDLRHEKECNPFTLTFIVKTNVQTENLIA